MAGFGLVPPHGPKDPEFPKKKPTPHTTAPSMYEIRSAGSKGLGVFANAIIPRGTRIFSERPLLAIRQNQDAGHVFAASRLISDQDRSILMSLSHHASKESSVIRWSQALKYTISQTASAILAKLGNPGGGEVAFPGFGLRDHVTVLSIFRSNSFNLGSGSVFRQALFPSISRINHSCVPNAQGNFHDKMGKFNVHATRDIEVDEELTLNYLHEHGAVRESRQKRLLDSYGFGCNCPACDLKLDRGRNGEAGRVQLQKVLGEYAEGVAQSGVESPKKELEMIKQLITLLEGDGIAGRELSTL